MIATIRVNPSRVSRRAISPRRSLAASGRRGALASQFAIGLFVVFAAIASVNLSVAPAFAESSGGSSFASTVNKVQPKIIKIFGSGGMRGLADYQSGFLISADGYVLTAWSHVLDTDDVTVILNDGRKFTSKLVGADPRLELAVLKIEATDLPFFDLSQPLPAAEGTRVLAFSNLFGVATGEEPASVLHGTIAAVTTLDARRGAYETPYQGPIYALDAMTNNPGAAGGALTDLQGNLLGVLGKELRNARNNVWLNFAIPTSELASSVEAIRTGKNPANTKEAKPKKPDNPLTLARLGLVLIPNVLDRTPPFVDDVRTGSAAASAGIRADDLILLVDSQVVQSCAAVQKELSQLEADAEVRLTLMRGNELIEVQVKSDQPQGQ
jgi:serine protease Do